jgi:hypothetical protein
MILMMDWESVICSKISPNLTELRIQINLPVSGIKANYRYHQRGGWIKSRKDGLPRSGLYRGGQAFKKRHTLDIRTIKKSSYTRNEGVGFLRNRAKIRDRVFGHAKGKKHPARCIFWRAYFGLFG